MRDVTTQEDMLALFALEKNKIRDYAGLPPIDVESFQRKAAFAYGGACQKAADICNTYTIDAAMWAEACFSLARSQRHPDGPLPNCFGSKDYGFKALSRALDIPLDAVGASFNSTALVRARELEYVRNREFLCDALASRKFGALEYVTDILALSMLTTVNVIDRYAVCLLNKEFAALNMDQLRERLLVDRITNMWAATKGITHEQLDNI